MTATAAALTTTTHPAEAATRARLALYTNASLVTIARETDRQVTDPTGRVVVRWVLEELEARAGGFDNPADPDAWQRMDAAMERHGNNDYLAALLETFPQLNA